jgi:hypothetical protein
VSADDDVESLVQALEALGPPDTWDEPPPPVTGLAVAIIDAVWSIGVKYASVENVLARYREARSGQGANADEDTAADFIDFVEQLGGPDAFAEQVNNRQRTSSKSGILKAEAVLREARMLAEEQIVVPQDVLSADDARLETLSGRWAEVPGQSSLVSWHYFLMRAGVQGVKPDRMIRRFVARALRRPGPQAVGTEEARYLVAATAEWLGVDPSELDHEIWDYERQRKRGAESC